MEKYTKRASSKARNHKIKPRLNGASQKPTIRADVKAVKFVPEFCRPSAYQPPKNLKTVIEYELSGIVNTPNTLYWGGRWPDDFFLGNRFSSQLPRKADLAEIMDWMASLDELGSFYGADAAPQGGETPWHVLFHALSLELRLHAPQFTSWSSCAPWFAKK